MELTFALGWAAFWIFWLVAAFFAKTGRILWSRELGIRAVIAVIVIVLVRSGVFRYHALNTEAWRDGLGLVLVATVGTAVALGWPWLIAAALAGINHGYAVTVEERFLTEGFPTYIRPTDA